MSTADAAQRALCVALSLTHCPAPAESTLGVARDVLVGREPLNGLRYPGSGTRSGWYLWAGEVLRDDDDFFVEMTVAEFVLARPDLEPFLGLPPGQHFLIADGQYEAWEDAQLLEG